MWFEEDGGTYYLNAMLDGERHNDPQDLVVDRAGRLWFTDCYTDDSIPGPLGYPPLPHNSVLRLTERARPNERTTGEWSLERMTFDTSSPGGIALSPDERTLYVADGTGSMSDARTLKAYQISRSGVLGPPKLLYEFPESHRAGGLCTDVHGNIVTTVAGEPADKAGWVEVVEPSGVVLETHEVEGNPTNCCFGGDGNRTLFVTTDAGQLYSSREARRPQDSGHERNMPTPLSV